MNQSLMVTSIVQLLPLAAFPIMFFIFFIPVFVYDIYYSFITPTPNDGLVISTYAFVMLWSMTCGLTLIVHIFVVQLPVWCRRRHNVREIINYNNDPTVTLGTVSCTNSATRFSLPTVSVVSNDCKS